METDYTLHDKGSHASQCALLEGSDAEDVSKEYGIKRNALLNELK